MLNRLSNNDELNKYRPEIDGLRAFAVIAVIINHFDKNLLPNGFLGVDIFFAISGYVITSSLASRKSSNFFEFIFSFYSRRIKRLVPSLIFFILISAILISFFNPYPEFHLRTGIASLFGLSNLYLLRHSTDYFAQSTALNVFAHTWSLGVEEQFYLLFPFITWFSGFNKRSIKGSKNLFNILLFLFIISISLYVYFYFINSSAAYFSMPSRFWELSIGSLLFIAQSKKFIVLENIKKLSPYIPLILIMGIMIIPSKNYLISTVSVALLNLLLINSLRKGTQLYGFFTHKKIIFIGLISYSLYLWHWAVISISLWTIGIHWWSIPFQIILIYILAVFSYKNVESPFRKKVWSQKSWITLIKGAFALVLSFISLISLSTILKGKLYLGKKLNNPKPYFANTKIDATCYDMPWDKIYNHEEVLEKCSSDKKNKLRTLFFLGDSHNHALSLGAEFIAKESDSQFFSFSGGNFLFPSVLYFEKNQRKFFLDVHKRMKEVENGILSSSKPGDIVFITNRFQFYFGEDWYEEEIFSENFRYFDKNNKVITRDSKRYLFEEWLINLKKFSNELSKKNVYVIIQTPTPEFPDFEEKCSGMDLQWFNATSIKKCFYEIPKDFFTSKNGKYSYIIKKLKEVTYNQSNLYLFDTFDLMCPTSKCKNFLDGKYLYRDDDHISNYSARYIIAPKITEFLNNINNN